MDTLDEKIKDGTELFLSIYQRLESKYDKRLFTASVPEDIKKLFISAEEAKND
jgi:hypothetical protein